MATRYPILYRSIQLIALLFVIVGYFFPAVLNRWEMILAVALIVLIGIPHGATDHLIFRYSTRPFLGTRRMNRFYGSYLLLIGLYALLWWLSPAISFVLFLVMSAYHFGQSNWNYASFPYRLQAGIYYMSWGAYVIVAPVLLHYSSVMYILENILRREVPYLNPGLCWWIVGGLLAWNLLLIVALKSKNTLSLRQKLEEILSLLVLSLVFLFTPVLLGFAVYFVFWHSMSSVMDQVRFFQNHKNQYSIRKYAKDTAPFTILAVAGLAGMFWVQFTFTDGIRVGWLFIFISIITLPHMLLIDQLYREASEKRK